MYVLGVVIFLVIVFILDSAVSSDSRNAATVNRLYEENEVRRLMQDVQEMNNERLKLELEREWATDEHLYRVNTLHYLGTALVEAWRIHEGDECYVDGCHRAPVSKGMCRKHYQLKKNWMQRYTCPELYFLGNALVAAARAHYYGEAILRRQIITEGNAYYLYRALAEDPESSLWGVGTELDTELYNNTLDLTKL